MKSFWLFALAFQLLIVACAGQEGGQRAAITCSCSPVNDLFATLVASGVAPARVENPSDAIATAPADSTVLLLADGYPEKRVKLTEVDFQKAAAKGLRLYVEFPSFVPEVSFEDPRKTSWERFVVSTGALGAELPKHSILMAHDSQILPCSVPDPLVVVARVAGYNDAVYGIPKDAQPILFSREGGRLIVATTKLSGFVRGRFAPAREWMALWTGILRRLTAADAPKLKWEPSTRPMYGPDDKLPEDFEQRAFQAAAKWPLESRLLLSEARWADIRPMLLKNLDLTEPPGSDYQAGDGRYGILEGYSSNIRHDGSQLQRTPIRADCQAESAMVLALDTLLNSGTRSGSIASNLLDFLYFNSDLCTGPRGDSKHPAFGLIGWGSTSPLWTAVTYGDDNARTMLATMLAAACLRTDRWDEPLLRALVANIRTTGKYGFRGDRVDLGPLELHGWRHFHDAETVNYAPHFEAFSWACFLWAYQHTGEREFLDKAKTAIRMTMEVFPDKWRWNDNMERAHMLLPLTWLVRVENTEEHRGWLLQVVNDLLAIQHPTGALPERFRGSAGSHFQIPASNEAYGTGETPLIQKNGDPVSDQLYVSGFVLLGLHEAAAVLGDPRVKTAEDKLAKYLCRIQIHSSRIPYLNGTWFRAFDFQRWEPWASSGDAGWGAWSIESGWAQAWTAAVLCLRCRNTTLWELTAETRIRERFPKVLADMSRNDGGPYQPASTVSAAAGCSDRAIP